MSAASDAAARNRLQSLNDTPSDRNEYAWEQATKQRYAGMGQVPTRQNIVDEHVGGIQALAADMAAKAAAVKPPTSFAPKVTAKKTTSRSSGGGGGGGGGGGSPMMSQSLIDWMANVLKSGRPAAQQYSPVDLPDAPSFNSAAYDQAMSSWNQAGTQDQGVINNSRQNMLNFLQSNYRNAYADPSVGSGGTPMGMDPAAMQRLMQMQGVNPNGNSALQQIGDEAARAQAMAGDWRQAMSGNEEQAQRNRLTNANQSADYSTNALMAALRGGQLQIGQARTQGEAASQQQAWQAALQEAQFNAQRQDTINAANAGTDSSYRNAVLQQLMALAQANVGNTGVTLPDMASLGLA